MGEVAELDMLAQQGLFQCTGSSPDSQRSCRQLADVETHQGETRLAS
jgi:hypothetical protein